MTTAQLHSFFAVASSSTYIDAAERLRITPSVLSKTIKSLEDEMGVVLFYKENSAILMTPAAEWLYPHFQYILAQYASIEQIASNFRTEAPPSSITIGSMYFSSYYRLIPLIQEVQKSCPYIRIDLCEYCADQINDMLHNYTLHSAFIYREFLKTSYPHILNIRKEPIVAVMRRELAEQYRAPISVCELADKHFLLMRGDVMLHNYLQRACIEAGFVPRESPMDLRVETIGELLNTADMVTLMMESFTPALLRRPGLAVLPVTDVAPLTLCLVSTRNFPPSGYKELESYLAAGFSHFGKLMAPEP